MKFSLRKDSSKILKEKSFTIALYKHLITIADVIDKKFVYYTVYRIKN